MSNFDKLSTIDAKLLNDLSAEQSEIVEGGRAMIRIVGLQAIRAGADTFGKDDTYITVNGQKIWGDVGMDTGDYKVVNRDAEMRGGFARVNLFDADGGLSGSDDSMGGFTVQGVGGGLQRVRVSGGGSTYDVYYGTYDAPDF